MDALFRWIFKLPRVYGQKKFQNFYGGGGGKPREGITLTVKDKVGRGRVNRA